MVQQLAKSVSTGADVDNALAAYYGKIAAATAIADPTPSADFAPPFETPPLTPAMRNYFAPSRLSMTELPPYRGRSLKLLNLMHNPSTRTTKTIASLMMVARAVRFIELTGESILIVTPTSGNKGTALRDAVLRAIEGDLVSADKLRIVTLVPHSSLPKLWSSRLSADPHLRRRNPVLVYGGVRRDDVKAIARQFVADSAAELKLAFGTNTWYTLDMDNYRIPDAVRAFFEGEYFPPRADTPRVHAHAVSSAYGLLGYHLGFQVLVEDGEVSSERHPRFLLVQHLETPDMVLNLEFRDFSRDNLPTYELDRERGLYVQDGDPRFPHATYDETEPIDPTFYTREPPTAAAINDIIDRHGGSGVVVSLYECLARYGKIRELLADSEISLPPDPRLLREWALAMVFTGVLNAIDRDLIAPDAEIVVHASGSYGDGEFPRLDANLTTAISDKDDVRSPVTAALA